MALVPAKCTQCGASLEVDSSKDAALCMHCNTPFVVEKAVHNHNTTVHNANQITAGVVNVYGGVSDDFVIEAGVLKKYKGAATDVVIPDGVKIIGKKAFFGLIALTDVTIPNGVTRIDGHAFNGCESIKSITIPSSVTSIGEGAFSDCINMEHVNIQQNVSMGKNVFLRTPYQHELERPLREQQQQLEQLEQLQQQRIEKGLCKHCGGKFNFFTSKCKNCGKKNF